MASSLEFLATAGSMTSSGGRGELFDHLPRDIGLLRRVVQGLMIHIFCAARYGATLDGPRQNEVQLRAVARKLERIAELDPRPLTEVREPDKRLVGNCRDSSLMLTAMLRHQRVPARCRCGFARYFIADHFEDHWVCEYWNSSASRWMLVDAQLDELQRDKLSISFDPLDVPRDQFLVGGKAWQLCREGQADPDTFGITDLHGLWFVRGNLVRDIASLNKVELLPWDSWGIIEPRDEDLPAGHLAFLDQLAGLTTMDVPEFDRVRLSYESDARLYVPSMIHSHTPAVIQTIDLTRI
jgi:hypothetical protein